MGDFAEAAAVTLFFGVGELFEHYAVGRSRKSIAALSEIRPDTANLLLPDGATQQVSAQEVEVGATLQILPFERIPLDGVVLSGEVRWTPPPLLAKAPRKMPGRNLNCSAA